VHWSYSSLGKYKTLHKLINDIFKTVIVIQIIYNALSLDIQQKMYVNWSSITVALYIMKIFDFSKVFQVLSYIEYVCKSSNSQLIPQYTNNIFIMQRG